MEDDLQQTQGFRLKFYISENLKYFFIFHSLMFRLFYVLSLFARRSFQCKSAHVNVIKNVGFPNA